MEHRERSHKGSKKPERRLPHYNKLVVASAAFVKGQLALRADRLAPSAYVLKVLIVLWA